jgi:uncharacterized protein YbjT (DUF2867 family)
MKVLMIGATGRFAGLVVPELKKKGVVIRAMAWAVKTGAQMVLPK